jgi:hypothetical protein
MTYGQKSRQSIKAVITLDRAESQLEGLIPNFISALLRHPMFSLLASMTDRSQTIPVRDSDSQSVSEMT